MKIAKADKNDISTTREFLQACENVMDKGHFSLLSPEDQWMRWNDDDPDKILVQKILNRIADEEGIDTDEVDNRVAMYEFLKAKYQLADSNWNRVILAADVLIDNVCDPMDNCLAFDPSFEINHVDREM